MEDSITKYVIKAKSGGYVTCHRRGRTTKNLASARTFSTYWRAEMNMFARMGGEIIPVEIQISKI